ncbi:ferredoxin [Natronosporangium hydrolyticum]|uniref:Ferredoxin n=1 Tax=Natronosporangium hydrolyticum TaxID=2811111 RepID=A0A895YJK5_9ACTN|nr:ferredoxin [Natronosporangium hydrolyticum]QSB16185.1 ferredoxin [Natronosporangium hydrolyticum]
MRSVQESLHLVAATVGFLSFFLMWLAVMWGMFLRNGWALTWVRHSTLLATHTTVALLGLTLGAVHAAAQLAKPANLFTVLDVLVPFYHWRDPIGTGVGIIGLYIMIAAAMSIMIQRWLGYSRWRALHTMTYVGFTLVTAHVLISGSDTGIAFLTYGVAGSWVVTVVVWLLTTPAVATIRSWLSGGEEKAARQKVQDVSVDVSAQRCARFGFCEHEAPDVFRLRSDGRLAYRASVPAEEAAPVVRAAEVCPARAITLSKVPTSMLTPGPPEPGRRDTGPPEEPVSPAVAGGPRRRRTPRYRD